MADDSVMWMLDVDASSAIAILDELEASLTMLSDSVTAVADSASSLTAVDDAMASLSAMTQQGAADAEALDAALSTVGDAAMATTSDIESLAASVDALATAVAGTAAGADTAAASVDAMGASAESTAGMMDGLQSAMGPLMMIGAVAAMAGAKLVSMGLDGQQGEALVQAMAGATTQDINALQQSALQLGETMPEAAAGFYQVESAGYAGSQGIMVLDDSIKAAKASHAQLSDVTSVATGILHAYNLQAIDVGGVLDKLIATTVQGKQSFGDLASAVGPLAAAGAHAGISLTDLLSAEAAMTQINPHVRQDAQQLTAIVKTFALGADATAASAKKLGISFDESTFKSKDFYGQLLYLRQQTEGNDKAFAKLVGGANGFAAAMDVLQGKGKAFADGQKNIGNSLGANDKAFAISEQTISAHLDKAGAAISVFATRLMDALGPKLIPVIDKVSSSIGTMADFLMKHGDVLNAVLSGLAAVIGTVLVGAMTAFVASAAPILLILAGIGLVVAGVVFAFQHWGQIMGQVNAALKIPAIHEIMMVLQSIGSYLASTFTPVWDRVVSTFNSEVKPAWNSLVSAVQPLMPALEMFAKIIGSVVAVAIILLISVIGGLLHAFASALSGVVTIFGGIASVISGAIKVATGIIAFFTDLVTLNFGKMGTDLGTIMDGIGTMFHGIWQIILGIFQTAIGAVIGFVAGFVQTIVGIFTNLSNTLVGHSIIPDMINGIVSWIEQLPGRAMSAINSFISQATSALSGLAGQALQWGADLVANLASGISGAIGQVTSAIGNVTSAIASHLHFSVPEQGPLADSDTWMGHMIDNFVADIQANQSKLKVAIGGMTSQVAQGITPPAGGIAGGGAGTLAPLGGSAAMPLLAGILATLQQQNKPSAPQTPPGVTMYNTNSLYGVQNINDLYNSLNAMSGYAYENGARGAL